MIYSYILKNDSGLAPNISGNALTLALCKPDIRRLAGVDDYLIGVNDHKDKKKNGDRIVFIAKINVKMTLGEYYVMCDENEDWKKCKMSTHHEVGDCQYKYEDGRYIQLPGCHTMEHYDKDISGENVLISTDFIYFGKYVEPIPDNLLGMKGGRGHQNHKNEPFREDFIKHFEYLKGKYDRKVIADPTHYVPKCD